MKEKKRDKRSSDLFFLILASCVCVYSTAEKTLQAKSDINIQHEDRLKSDEANTRIRDGVDGDDLRQMIYVKKNHK